MNNVNNIINNNYNYNNNSNIINFDYNYRAREQDSSRQDSITIIKYNNQI